MADFRKWIYALAVVALLAGLSIPASAQGTAVTCNNGGGTTPIVRSEGLTELMGDIVLNCTGGNPTIAGQVVPPVNITIILGVTITSKITAASLYNEAILIIDEPNQSAPGPNSNRPILNCGSVGAPDTGTESGPGVCSITSNGNPAQTYDGTQNVYGQTGGTAAVPAQVTCGSAGTPTPPLTGGFGCGRPNVFQGRQGNPFNTGLINNISFLGVPIDPPGTGTTRTLRFTNIRGNANQDAIASTFIQTPITAQIAINGTTAFSINLPAGGQVVAFVQRGLIATVLVSRLNFVQCNTENGKLFAGSPFGPLGGACGTAAGGGCNGPIAGTFANTPTVRLSEGFASSWKVRNYSEIIANGAFNGVGWTYQGTINNPVDINQNVPGGIYNTEAGFEYPGTGTGTAAQFANPTPNPPNGVGNGPATGAINTGFAFNNGAGAATSTAFSQVGIATQGTRLYLSFANVPTGSSVFVPPTIYFFRQNQAGGAPIPATFVGGVSSGVAVLITPATAAGDGAYTPAGTTNLVAVPTATNLAVYEVLFDDPLSLESVDIPAVVAYTANLSANPPIGLPVTGTIATVSAGFAPFYTSAAAFLPAPAASTATATSFPIPRFTPTPPENVPQNLFEIQKCACDLLFPFVASTGGFDTGIAIANTSLDPGATYGFGATPQQGTVTFFYFGVGNNGAAPPAQQTSGVVPAGQVLTYVLSSGGGGIGTGSSGLDNRAAGFEGYIIAQSGFQYCHAFAFISALGGGPTSAGISEGYLGLILDLGGISRTGQASENLVH
jgi:hypothetical protein